MKNKCKSKQLSYWQGKFGNDYIKRNSDLSMFKKRKKFFQKLLEKYPQIKNILEVGCNIGGNLLVLHEINPNLLLSGIEPNKTAYKKAKKLFPKAKFINKSSFEITEKETYDLVFTAGVLIHVANSDLLETLKRMYTASKRYILTIEYYSAKPVTVSYRGFDDALFKRPFDKIWEKNFPNLQLIEKGHVDKEYGFDNCHWWMFEKNENTKNILSM